MAAQPGCMCAFAGGLASAAAAVPAGLLPLLSREVERPCKAVALPGVAQAWFGRGCRSLRWACSSRGGRGMQVSGAGRG